jgi:magnesium chelatase subunit I
LIEQISFEARNSEYIDAKSGVSARLSVSALENLYSSAQRRQLINGEDSTRIRLLDFIGVIPSVTGKVELVYEGEQEGSEMVAENLIGSAIKALLPNYFPALDKLKNSSEDNPYQGLMNWFGESQKIDLSYDMSDSSYQKELSKCEPLKTFIQAHQKDMAGSDRLFVSEFVLWALSEHSKINRDKLIEGLQFSDLFQSYLSGLQDN